MNVVQLNVLNTMFNKKSNTVCNNALFSYGRIVDMERKMHPTMERLYIASKKLKGVEGHAGLTTLFNESPQLITNWEKRGISKAGLIKAQRIVGCSALWLETGEGPIVFGALPETATEQTKSSPTYSKSIQAMIALMIKLDQEDQGRLLGRIEVMRDELVKAGGKQQKVAGQTGK